MNKIMFRILGMALLFAVLTSCRENEFGVVDLTMPEDNVPEIAYTYNHPCAMYNQADFDRVKVILDAGTAPQAVKDEFQNLKSNKYTRLPYTPQPQVQIVRGDPKGTTAGEQNYTYAMRDAAAAYQMALLWKLTGNAEYANASVGILNAWADVCKEITSNDYDYMLAAGCQGYTFANAAEIMQTYEGWNTADIADFKTWIAGLFGAKNKEFLEHRKSDVCAEHYWSNWDLVNMCSYLAIGILTEDDEMVNYVVNYFYNGAGNGCIKRLIQGTFTDPLGTGETICQNQESGRDQGHAQMSLAVAANLCQMAYTFYLDNKEDTRLDFFAANDNAILAMGEYVALSNLRDGEDKLNKTGSWLVATTEMPFSRYVYCTGCSCKNQNHGATQISITDDAGRGSLRPCWELLYNHYAKVKGLSSGYKYAQMFAQKNRPEGGAGDVDRYGDNSGAFDQLGWGTLMLYRE